MSDEPSDRNDSPTLTRDVAQGVTNARPVSLHAALAQGQTFGPYLICRLLGKGGMGEVYEAELRESGRRVALKILADRDPLPEARERFLSEGRLAASISHRNSVYIYGTEEIDGQWAISMELLGGGSLSDRMRKGGPLPPREAVDAILQVIDGLEAAASAGILHRDIKPANCFVEVDGTVKIGDFGLSLSTLTRDRSRAHLTETGAILGTPAFASPEQMRGDDLDVRSDIYSVGATLFYLLTGRAPFEADNLVKLIAAIASETPRSPRTLQPKISRDLASIVLQCLARRPEGRPQDYAALSNALLSHGTETEAPHAEALSILATAVDTGLAYALGAAGISIVGDESIAGTTTDAHLVFAAASLVTFGLPFLIAGRSIGERLLGLRTRNWLGGSLERGQVLGRLLLTVASAGWLLPQPRGAFGAVLLPGFLGRLIRLSTRRTLPRPKTHFRETREFAPKGGARLGPYLVANALKEGSFVRGFDPILSREVWIAGGARRSVVGSTAGPARETRLRKVQEGGRESDSWAAYEAPSGRSLQSLNNALPWDEVRHLLLQVAREILLARAEGSLPVLSLDRVWLTADSRRLVLLEHAPPGAGAGDGSASFSPLLDGSALAFMREVAVRLLGEGPRIAPRNALCFLDELEGRSFERLESAETMLAVLCRGQSLRRPLDSAILALIGLYPVVLPLLKNPEAETAPLVIMAAIIFLIWCSIRWGQWRDQAAAAGHAQHSIEDGSEEVIAVAGGPPSFPRWIARDVVSALPTLVCWLLLRYLEVSTAIALPVTLAVFLLSFGSDISTGLGFQGRLTGTRRVASHRPFGDRPPLMSRYETLRYALPSKTPANEDAWRSWELTIASHLPPLTRFLTYGAGSRLLSYAVLVVIGLLAFVAFRSPEAN